MRIFSGRKGVQVAVALAATIGTASLSAVTVTSQSAQADPAWGVATSKIFVAVGSNTIEDLLDAYAGVAPTPGDAPSTEGYHHFTPLADPTTGEQVYSWDAVNQSSGAADCISAKPGFAPIARPNGSTDGYKAISDSITGTAWNKATNPAGCVSVSPTGMIDIGRSSGGPKGSACGFAGATCLAWVDFAHDAVSYAYYIQPGATATPSGGTATPVTTGQVDHLSNAQLTSMYTSSTGTYTDPATGITYAACLPQLGSGTEGFWIGTLNGGSGIPQTGSGSAEAAATAANCVNFEENGANTFQTFATTAFSSDSGFTNPPVVAVTPFSVGSWVSQSNQFAFDRSTTGIANGVHMGYVDGASSGLLPYTGTAPNEAPNTAFYGTSSSPTLYGRDLWLDVNNASLNGKTTVSAALRDLLGYIGTNYAGASGTSLVTSSTTSTGQICQAPYATTDLSDFGFTAPVKAACGAETLTVTTSANGA